MTPHNTSSDQVRIAGTLFTAQSLFSAAMIAAFTLMPILAADLSGEDSAAGLPSTMALLGRALVAYPVGWLMDKIGRRWGLSTGYGIGVVGMAMATLAVINGSFLGFLLGVMLFGMGRGTADQGRYVAAEVFPEARRAKVIGLIVFAGTVGSVLGPQLVDWSGRQMERWEITADAGPFALGIFFLSLALLLIQLFLRPDPREMGREMAESERDKSVPPTAGRPLRRIFADPVVLLAVMSMVIGQLVMTLIMVITPLHMDDHAHTTRSISLVISAHTLGMFGLSAVTGWLIDQFGRYAMIVTGALILITAAVLTPLSTAVPFLAAALFLLGLGWNFCFVAGSSLLSDALAASERGRAQGASEVVVALASGTGSLSTGIVFAQGGIVAVSSVGLAFALALTAVMVWNRKRPIFTRTG